MFFFDLVIDENICTILLTVHPGNLDNILDMIFIVIGKMVNIQLRQIIWQTRNMNVHARSYCDWKQIVAGCVTSCFTVSPPQFAFKKPPPFSLDHGWVCVAQLVDSDVAPTVVADLVPVVLLGQPLAQVG